MKKFFKRGFAALALVGALAVAAPQQAQANDGIVLLNFQKGNAEMVNEDDFGIDIDSDLMLAWRKVGHGKAKFKDGTVLKWKTYEGTGDDFGYIKIVFVQYNPDGTVERWEEKEEVEW